MVIHNYYTILQFQFYIRQPEIMHLWKIYFQKMFAEQRITSKALLATIFDIYLILKIL